MINRVNGIERTELEYHEWIESSKPVGCATGGGKSSKWCAPGVGKPQSCSCPGKSYESIDSNEGTGDHERLRLVCMSFHSLFGTQFLMSL